MGTKQQWDSAVDIYNEGMGEEGDKLNNNLIHPTIRKILGNISNKTILDSGCGSGYFSAEIAKNAKSVIGTDFSGKFIELCQRKYKYIQNLKFQMLDVTEQMPFNTETFDIVISKMVLQYVKDILVFAQEAHRVLKSQGHLIIAIDHPFNTQFYFAQKLTGSNNPKYQTLSHYFDSSAQTKLSLWDKVELTWYPKKIEDYLSPFILNGFCLNSIKEIEEEKQNTLIPRILILDFLK
ncbi:MAG: class I SAM-dependent methyltransferase [Candidatus Roizmanbacteria bacterium]|nr:class I SAM-dependent methyltransferase [Candidatus Roizmanbacteria bacterium]